MSDHGWKQGFNLPQITCPHKATVSQKYNKETHKSRSFSNISVGPSGRQAITKRSLCCRPQMLLEDILSFRVGGRQGCGHSLPNCHKNAKSYPEVSYLGACDYSRQFGSGPEPFQLSTIFGNLTSCIGEHGCSIFFWACQLTIHWLRHQWIIH